MLRSRDTKVGNSFKEPNLRFQSPLSKMPTIKPPELLLRTMSADLGNITNELFKTLTDMRTTTDFASTSRSRSKDNERGRKNYKNKGFLLTEISTGERTSRSTDKTKVIETVSQVRQYCSSPTRFVYSKAPQPRPHTVGNYDEIKIFRDLHRRYRVVRGEERNLHDTYSTFLKGPSRVLKTACDFNANYI